jgi:hypothetical protein
MVMTHHQFRCEICEEAYNSQTKAVECEKKGQPRLVFPRGLIFRSSDLNNDKWLYTAYVVKKDTIIGHLHSLECWRIDITEIVGRYQNWGPQEFDHIAENTLKIFNFSSILIDVWRGDPNNTMIYAAIEFCKYRGMRHFSPDVFQFVPKVENNMLRIG